jgi:hypothetical protein
MSLSTADRTEVQSMIDSAMAHGPDTPPLPATDDEKAEVLDFCRAHFLAGHEDVRFVGDGTAAITSVNARGQATHTHTADVVKAMARARADGSSVPGPKAQDVARDRAAEKPAAPSMSPVPPVSPATVNPVPPKPSP